MSWGSKAMAGWVTLQTIAAEKVAVQNREVGLNKHRNPETPTRPRHLPTHPGPLQFPSLCIRSASSAL